MPLQAETAELARQARAEMVTQVPRRGGRNLGNPAYSPNYRYIAYSVLALTIK